MTVHIQNEKSSWMHSLKVGFTVFSPHKQCYNDALNVLNQMQAQYNFSKLWHSSSVASKWMHSMFFFFFGSKSQMPNHKSPLERPRLTSHSGILGLIPVKASKWIRETRSHCLNCTVSEEHRGRKTESL